MLKTYIVLFLGWCAVGLIPIYLYETEAFDRESKRTQLTYYFSMILTLIMVAISLLLEPPHSDVLLIVTIMVAGAFTPTWYYFMYLSIMQDREKAEAAAPPPSTELTVIKVEVDPVEAKIVEILKNNRK